MSSMGTARQKWQIPSRHDAKADRKREAEALERAVFAAVDARDKRICRCCGHRSNIDGVGLLDRGHRHHITYRSKGGAMSQVNICLLCADCHAEVHHKRLDVRGNAEEALSFWRRDEAGAWYCVRQEVAPHVVDRD